MPNALVKAPRFSRSILNALLYGENMTLTERIEELKIEHGSLRQAAKVLNIDVAYLSRIGSGKKVNPSEKTLIKLGLKLEVDYARI